MFQSLTAFKITDDDWHPSYTFNHYYNGHAPGQVLMVEVSLLQFPKWERNPDPGYRVCVWGNDDCGMERDFGPEELDIAYKIFHDVIALHRVNKQTLTDMGFIYA